MYHTLLRGRVYFFCIAILKNTVHKFPIVLLVFETSLHLHFQMFQFDYSQMLVVGKLRTLSKWQRHLQMSNFLMVNFTIQKLNILLRYCPFSRVCILEISLQCFNHRRRCDGRKFFHRDTMTESCFIPSATARYLGTNYTPA